jgi:4-hydroxy-tetrahydrodipicolinate reductase
MGQALVRCSRRLEGLQLAAAVERAGCPAVGKDAGLIAGIGETGIRIGTAPAEAAQAADVLVDFSVHDAVPAAARAAAQAGKGLVIGTTGLSPDERKVVEESARVIPVVWAPNMSLGVNLLFALVERAAGVLGLDYDVEIVETHHHFKKDAPSGTALRLGEKVAEGRTQAFGDVAVYGRAGVGGERPRGQIGIHALRAGDVVGDHTVLFATEGEQVTLGHRATSRDAFAMGALRAALWVHGRPPGLYGMHDVLGL